ncbi:MAG: antitoxin MazE family protein [Gemmatimonadota bacterium]|nr:antitoxin MazE family protein [Gemmatimonadota bacterium]
MDRHRLHHDRDRGVVQGMRPIQIWVPDVRSPEFRAEAHRQAAAVAETEHEAEDQTFIDEISDLGTA